MIISLSHVRQVIKWNSRHFSCLTLHYSEFLIVSRLKLKDKNSLVKEVFTSFILSILGLKILYVSLC